jgi:hypothetical protein
MIQAFKEVGIEYRNRMWDDKYDNFERKTKRTPEKDRIKFISNLKKLIIPDTISDSRTEEQYIIYDMNEKAKDSLGNELTANRSNIGCYHKPKVKREMKLNDEGDKVPVVVGIDELETKYSIPFTKENIAKIEKYVNPYTQFSIQKMDGRRQRITVSTFEDWKNVENKYLLRFGHKPSDYEKTLYANELQGKYETYHPPVSAGPQYR